MNINDLVDSGRIFSGGLVSTEQRFTYTDDRPWIRRIINAYMYLDIVSRWNSCEEPNEIPNLANLIEELDIAFGTLVAQGTGPAIDKYWLESREVENRLLNHPGEAELARRIAAVTGEQHERMIFAHLQGLAYGHLLFSVRSEVLCPGVKFRLVDVLWDSYFSGLVPIGVFDGALDDNYSGDDILLCINPSQLLDIK